MITTTIDLENTYTSGVYGKRAAVIVRGEGALLWDTEGREYIDCTAGYGVANIGHGRTELAAALAAQAQRLVTCPEFLYNDVRAQLLERLAHLTPEGLDHMFLCNSGTEAIEGALKFARLATGRTGIVATLRGFHGRTMGALSTTWEPHYREPFAPLVPDVRHIRYNDLTAAKDTIHQETAAVIIELVQGEGGVHVATDEYVHGLATLCRERGVLLIVDEVQTGFGRTGRPFACEHYNLSPDILCLAKSIAGGVPMGAVCLGARVMESGRITKGVHGSTFGGNPLACAAALTTLDILGREALPERAAALGRYALERLRAIRSPLVRDVRGCGLLLGIELTRRAQPYIEVLQERGVFVLQAGPNVIRLLPPLVITEEQLERALDVIEEMLTDTAQDVARGTASASVTQRPVGVSPCGHPRLAHEAHPGHPQGDAPTGSFLLSAHLAHPGHPQGDAPTGSFPLEGRRISTNQHEISLLRDMLTIPSYSGREHALALYLVEQARGMGLHASVDDVGNVVACTHADIGQERPIVLLGHMDTVRGSVPVRVQDDSLYGRGAVDAKGPLAAFLCATARLAREGNVQRPIVVVGAVEEESATSRGARAVVERYRPSACIIGEPSGSHAVTLGYKGRLLVEGHVACPASHSAGPQHNSSEIAVAFWERVRAHAAVWNEQYAQNSSFAALLPSLRTIASEQDGLEERTHFLVGYRLPPAYDIAGLRTQLEQWAFEDEIQLSFSGEEVAYQTTRTNLVARAFLSAIRAVGGKPTFKHKTGTSDMNMVGPVWGQNIVAYGPGDSRLDHTPDEHIELAEYIHAIEILTQVLRELSQEGEVAQ